MASGSFHILAVKQLLLPGNKREDKKKKLHTYSPACFPTVLSLIPECFIILLEFDFSFHVIGLAEIQSFPFPSANAQVCLAICSTSLIFPGLCQNYDFLGHICCLEGAMRRPCSTEIILDILACVL